MKYELLIFDMDGTLVQSEDCASQALIDVIPALRGETAQAVTAKYKGMRLATIFDDIEARVPGSIPDNVLDRYRERENQLSATMIKPSAGAGKMLEQIAGNKCIASNAPIEKTRRSLNICQLAHHFDNEIYSAYQVKAWKPDPTLFLFAAAEFGIEPGKCLVVEDSEVGIEAAVAAGMDSVFYDPHFSINSSVGTNAINHLKDLLQIL